MYAARFPKEVEGSVLVDASHPDMWTRLQTYPASRFLDRSARRGPQALARTCAAMVGRPPALDQQQPGGCGRDPRRAGGDRASAAGGTYLLGRAFGATLS
jgi:hypothetical protein